MLPGDPQLGHREDGERDRQVHVGDGDHADDHARHEEDQQPTGESEQPALLEDVATEAGEQDDRCDQQKEAEEAQEDGLRVVVPTEEEHRRGDVVVERGLEGLVGQAAQTEGPGVDRRVLGVHALSDGELLLAGQCLAEDGVRAVLCDVDDVVEVRALVDGGPQGVSQDGDGGKDHHRGDLEDDQCRGRQPDRAAHALLAQAIRRCVPGPLRSQLGRRLQHHLVGTDLHLLLLLVGPAFSLVRQL